MTLLTTVLLLFPPRHHFKTNIPSFRAGEKKLYPSATKIIRIINISANFIFVVACILTLY